MKTKTSFKHMYLVDNNLYNKLSINSNLNTSSALITNNILDRNNVLSHPQNIAIKPNIHIHNKHAPSSSSLSHFAYADTPPPPPPHAPPPLQPHVSEIPSSLTHAQVGIHNTNHDVSTNTNTNTNFNTDKQSLSHPKTYPSSARIVNKLTLPKHSDFALHFLNV